MERGDDSVDGDLYMKKQTDFVVKKSIVDHDEHKIVKATHIIEKAKKQLSSTTTTTVTTKSVSVKVYKIVRRVEKITKISTH